MKMLLIQRYLTVGSLVLLAIFLWLFLPKVHITIQFSVDGGGDQGYSKGNVLDENVAAIESKSNQHDHIDSSSNISAQFLQWQKELALYSPNSFVFMFGTTAIQVYGSVPSECALLFIGIHSGPDMADRRQAMRDTYLKGISSNIVYRFILGYANPLLVMENSEHKDIVFINQTDRYSALDSVLPYKAASIFLMASKMTVRPSWLLKTDDDSIVNLPAVLKKLQTFKENEYYGKCETGWYPVRLPSNKWHVSEKFWPDNKPYPPFCVGTGYFMSQKAYVCAARNIQSPSHKYFPREDVSGGILMSQCNITAVRIPHVYSAKPKNETYFLIQHYVKTPELVHKWWKYISVLNHAE